MRPLSIAVAAAALCGAAGATQSVAAQAPCSIAPAVVDSAKEDAMSVLTSERPLVVELRQEQGISKPNDIRSVNVVNDRSVCAHIASAFNRVIAPGIGFAVLRIGPIYYARDPDQRRGTGVFTDSTFHVLMRLGVASPTPNDSRNR